MSACRVTPRGEHKHRHRTASDVRYLHVWYYVRIHCAERRTTAGVQAYIEKLAEHYDMTWTPLDIYRSMQDMAYTCAECGRGRRYGARPTLQNVWSIFAVYAPDKPRARPVNCYLMVGVMLRPMWVLPRPQS